MNNASIADAASHPMTRKVLEVFEDLSRIPRQSKHEAQLRAWVEAWAGTHGFAHHSDAVGNVVVEVPATPGFEDAPILVLQGHMDMVCEKTPSSTHDFATDPLVLTVEDGWLTAVDTTLGADNGIAIAIAMVLATEPTVAHPRLELLFTMDEESGMTGANGITAELFAGRTLLNLDSEDEGVFTVGCAGGCNTALTYPIERSGVAVGDPLVLEVGGLKGGHSGVDIALQRANAIRLLARTLRPLLRLDGVQLVTLTGGSAHNAIPRDALAELIVPADSRTQAEAAVAAAQAAYQVEWQGIEPTLRVALRDGASSPQTPLSPASANFVVDVLMALPHGVAAMSSAIAGLVETSNNEAKVSLDEATLTVVSSQRSSVGSRLVALTDRVESIGRLGGGTVKTSDGYPPWQPDMSSPVLARCVALYETLTGKEPVVEVIHAGLECGIIGARVPGMDMVSLGPTLKYPHSPDERLEIDSVGKIWDFLVVLLASYRPAA